MDAPPMPIGTRRSAFFRWRLAGLICLLVLLLATLSSPFWLSAHSLSTPLPSQAIRGVVVFSSSGQLDPTSATGLNDQITVQIEGVPTPPTGKSEYAWLLPDPGLSELPPVLLGRLGGQKGQASSRLYYADPQHLDLLASYSRFLLTEEPTDPAPILPSPNPATWRASGSIPDLPTPGDPNRFSYLDHLRHLLAADPDLQRIGLNGGLAIWLYRNAEKILEWASAARDDWADTTATALLRREIVRIVDYLDGTLYAGKDVPPGTPLLVNPRDGRIGLLEQAPLENPPAYLTHVDLHLNGLMHAPGATPAERQLATQIDGALRQVTAFMEAIHADAVRLVQMSDAQLQQAQALSLLNDLTTRATSAFVGQSGSANTGTQGVAWINVELGKFAIFSLVSPPSTRQGKEGIDVGMTTGLAGIFLGASVAILWGLADSMAGIAARRVGTMKTTLVEQAGGLIALALLGVLARVQLSLLVLSPAALMQSVLVGVLLGIVGTGAYFGLYRSLELGPWAIVSPVVGGQGAVTLILAVVFLHNQLDLIHLLLLVIILLGILLASTKIEQLTTQGRKLSAWLSRGVRFALLSMLCFGVLSFGLGAAASTTTSWFLILFWARLFCLIFVGCTALVVSPPSVAQEEPHRTREYLLAAGGGIVEVGGYIAFIAAAQLTSTAVAGVCASMVPLIPLLYGIFVLHERIHFNQCIGIVLALAGFIALPLDQGQSKWLLICIVGAVGAGVMVKQGHWTLPAPVFARKSRSPTDRSRKKWWPG